ncbi:glycosyltransferase [Clostridium sp.]
MKKILILSNMQFGYLVDTLKYCEYLGDIYKIGVVCVDDGLPKVVKDNIQVEYIKNDNKYMKRINFIKSTKAVADKFNPDVIFFDYFRGCSIVKLFLGNKFVYNVDIRTGSINTNYIKRKIMNFLLKVECSIFKNVSIISKGLQQQIGIRTKTVHWLPLGGDLSSEGGKLPVEKSKRKNYKAVYVGTLFRRNIGQTVVGIKYFVEKYTDEDYDITYDIIGGSHISEDEELIKKYIYDLGLSDIIRFHGRLDHNSAMGIVSKADIGISYIPITKYFNFQPPTKTFEYLLAGLPCLATNTFENAQIVKEVNGVIIKDNPEDFCHGLYKIINNYENYNSCEIVKSVEDYTWENIVLNNLQPYINSIIK